jgi:hypothetical protein
MNLVMNEFDPHQFWEQSQYARHYFGGPVTDDVVELVEHQLGYKLPKAYIELMKVQNGGFTRKRNFSTKEDSLSWAEDHIAITGIFSIGSDAPMSLCGKHGSQFWIDEWNYPPIGVYFADCPSAGYDMVCLDYRSCGPIGEPQVVHVAWEFDNRILVLAEDFQSFICGLKDDDAFARSG